MRLEGKVAVIVGAGQSPGEGIGNGRATTLRFAQEGARILAVDLLIASAEETAAMAAKEGGECVPFGRDQGRDARRRGGSRSGALGAHRYPSQQCRGQHCGWRQAAGRA